MVYTCAEICWVDRGAWLEKERQTKEEVSGSGERGREEDAEEIHTFDYLSSRLNSFSPSSLVTSTFYTVLPLPFTLIKQET